MTHDQVNARPRPSDAQGVRRRLALTTALLSVGVFGYGGRAAYAGSCTGAAGVFTCSGAATGGDVTQVVNRRGLLTVTVADGFGINVASGNAFILRGRTNGLSFTDTYGAAITGSVDGINALNEGIGALSVTATGAVSGTSGYGIYARIDSIGGTDLTINAADVTGGNDGIRARNEGFGALSVTATGAVSGGRYGIVARNSSTDLTIAAADVTGGNDGIFARNYGIGALSVTATGAVSGGRYGIVARSYGSGALSVTATGAVNGTGDDGIYARNSYGTDLTIAAADVAGGNDGINAYNFGSGALSVTATGAVNGAGGNGINASNSGTDLTIAAADVTGGNDGIYAVNEGSGALSVTATGAVSGGTGTGIATITGAGKATTIDLNDGASVTAASGLAITNDAGDSTVTVNTGASVTGAIQLGDGRDSLIFDGGDFSGVTAFDGGGGADDALRFGAGAVGVLDASLVTGFETVRFGAGSAVSVFDTLVADVSVEAGASVSGAIRLGDGSDSLIFDGGDFSGVTAFDGGGGADDALRFDDGAAGVLDGGLVTGFESVFFGAGSALAVFDTLVADVWVEAGGVLAPGSSPGALHVDGAFDAAAGATLSFELGGLTPGTEYDVLDVAGTATLADATIFEILDFGGFLPTIGDTFDILIADTISLTSLSNLTFDFAIGGFWSASIFDLSGRDALRLEAIAGPVAPVPVPPALAMFGSGLVSLFGLGWARRRKQRPAA